MFHLLIFFISFLSGTLRSETVVSGAAFKKICDIAIDRRPFIFDPSLVKEGDVIFISKTNLADFFHLYFPRIQKPFILVSGTGGGELDERYLPFLESPKLIHWFATHLTFESPKATLIPLGGPWHTPSFLTQLDAKLPLLQKESYFKKKPISIYVNWTSEMHESRDGILHHFASMKNCKISPRVSFQKYLKEMGESRFVISPRGVNIDCYRTWEALIVGSIPVVESWGIDRIYEDLPVIIVEDLTKVTEEFLQSKYERLKLKDFCLEKLTIDFWIEKLRAS